MSDDMDRFFGDKNDPKPEKKERKSALVRTSEFAEWLSLVPMDRRKEVADVIRRMNPKTYQDIPGILNELLAFTIEGVLTPSMLDKFERMLRLQFDILTFDRVQEAKVASGQRSPLFVGIMNGSIAPGPERNRIETTKNVPTLTMDEQIANDSLDLYGDSEVSQLENTLKVRVHAEIEDDNDL
jgi:hypothetical protein